MTLTSGGSIDDVQTSPAAHAVDLRKTYGTGQAAVHALAGINVAIFELTAGRTVYSWTSAPSAPRVGKAVAAVSLVLWIGIIFMGRIIGFTTHPGNVAPPTPGVNYDDFLQSPSSSGSSGGTSAVPRPAPTKK